MLATSVAAITLVAMPVRRVAAPPQRAMPAAYTSTRAPMHAVDPRGDGGERTNVDRPSTAPPPVSAAAPSHNIPWPVACSGLVGLVLAVAGILAVLQRARWLRRLAHARIATRTGAGFVLEDGRAVRLDRDTDADEALVIAAQGAPGYRVAARADAELIGTGSRAALQTSLRAHIAIIALATALTSGTACAPLVILCTSGWTIAWVSPS
jgi:hypothetical protein